ncbi:TPA: sensor histidine kinase [Xanthomonas vasicola pv. zeae]|uniref:histidine kinase n=3 Tax=Xanthomonas vasicola TaxID=56459 RepID=A0A836P5V1_XANVA|nr:sensor histidine kinase [Xanthomonas vasicola]KFA21240.1 histidine kinase [Xanthomonas vasicola pv. musacearum NCPPB 4384]AVQ08726.1 sensor histidine kinase [Xanthomonas vasicola pv. vasculorum]AZM72974.1 sensor histidine kinase [Xanthomonas vasicola pv. vasculorum]AZR24495.1 sensor histidine kinase [Xanthomonas vasicola]AZR28614.1 sensor histidine kinase [Xanthomonas vasicola pv. arecae]
MRAKRTLARPSLRRRLLLFLAVPMLVLLAIDAAVTYRMALGYANRVHDKNLADDLQALTALLRQSPERRSLSSQAQFLLRYDPDGANYFAVLSRRQGWRYGDTGLHGMRQPALGKPPALYWVDDGVRRLRAASVAMPSPYDAGDVLTVTIAESLIDRQRTARTVLWLTLPVQTVLIIAVMALVWLGVNHGLRVLRPLTERLAAREQALAPVTGPDVPQEILPLTLTLDALFVRVRHTVQLHERFIADAAHQLRTPLAGLQLHAERAMGADPEQTRAALLQIQQLTARAARAASQLLALSRAQSPHHRDEAMVPVLLYRLIPEAVAARVPDALAADVDLGYQADSEDAALVVFGDPLGLQELLDNLIDNALRYAGRGCSVTVGLAALADAVVLSVEDDGPGVPDALLGRLGERFFRVPGMRGDGCGLGLAIVQGVAQRHNARVVFCQGAHGGLRVEIRFPPRLQ